MKSTLAILALLLAVGMLVVGCSQQAAPTGSAQETANTATGSATSDQTAIDKTVVDSKDTVTMGELV